MKRILLIIITLLYLTPVRANHIAGGELFYEYLGSSGGKDSYRITMRLFRDCNSTGQTLDAETVNVGIYNTVNGSLVGQPLTLVRQSITTIALNTAAIPCLIGSPEVCFQVGIFSAVIDLDKTSGGYTLAWVRCCRSNNISNLSMSVGAGATFITHIPGTQVLPLGHNSSPQFLVKDTALVCQNKNFTLDFGAVDKDGDSLSYSFCSAYTGGSQSDPNPGPSQTLNLSALGYASPYSGFNPLGVQVSIDPATGKITGTAPANGRYVVNVCVTEWRNGIQLNEHRKDFILEVGDCDYAGASPIPVVKQPYASSPPFSYNYISCKDFNVKFFNSNSSSIIQNYYWDFGVLNSTTDTSTNPKPSFTYPDTGTYTVKLIVKGASTCIDSNTVQIAVYPGFKAGFTVTGSCYKNPFNFTDTSSSPYAVIKTRIWNFGEPTLTTDTSTQQNPSYTYPGVGTKSVKLVVTDTKGCIDTVFKSVVVLPGPALKLPFHDTLICSIDTLQLHAIGSGSFTWSPVINISDIHNPDPFVAPKDTTVYVVSLTANSCTSVDSIKVNVLDSIDVYAGNDTIICLTDNIVPDTKSYGLQYNWLPSQFIYGSANVKSPVLNPAIINSQTRDTAISYYVTAHLGKCLARDTIKVRAVRYPKASVDSLYNVCFGDTVRLHAAIQGSSFTWSPTFGLTEANTLHPLANPQQTITYLLTVTDTIGCPKPATASTIVKVIPPVSVFAGNDTNVLVGHPFQLNAIASGAFVWTPITGMDNPYIPNPTVILYTPFDSIIYRVSVTTPEGCKGHDFVKVKVFAGGPDIYVPSAFTPNGDGKNDVLRPVPAGIKQLNYFRVYNRLGQLVYTTSNIGAGWDGYYKGTPQGTGTFVYMAEAIDFTGQRIFRKGTAVLIR